MEPRGRAQAGIVARCGFQSVGLFEVGGSCLQGLDNFLRSPRRSTFPAKLVQLVSLAAFLLAGTYTKSMKSL